MDYENGDETTQQQTKKKILRGGEGERKEDFEFQN